MRLEKVHTFLKENYILSINISNSFYAATYWMIVEWFGKAELMLGFHRLQYENEGTIA
jgi:hypothetical protein